jgi:hypothetical protein
MNCNQIQYGIEEKIEEILQTLKNGQWKVPLPMRPCLKVKKVA